MKTIKSTPEMTQAVVKVFSGRHPFRMVQMDPQLDKLALKDVVQEDLVALKDDSYGGIIGWVKASHAERIKILLNAAAIQCGVTAETTFE